jgi:hypothetical protein
MAREPSSPTGPEAERLKLTGEWKQNVQTAQNEEALKGRVAPEGLAAGLTLGL